MNTNFVIQFMAQPISGRGANYDRKSLMKDGTSQSTQVYGSPKGKTIRHVYTSH